LLDLQNVGLKGVVHGRRAGYNIYYLIWASRD
jgi:hypothetical protein